MSDKDSVIFLKQDQAFIGEPAPFGSNVRGLVWEVLQEDAFGWVSNLGPNRFPKIGMFLSRNPI
jgi:hypothetical protein